MAAAGCLVAAVSLVGGEGRKTDQAAGRDDPGRGGAPTRIAPTAFPTPSVSVSSSASPSSPSSPAPPYSPSASATSPPAGYDVWAGPGCSGGHYREEGRFSNGDAGWYTVTSGGFRGAGCDGRFSAIPMSGSPTADRDNAAIWSWRIGDGYTSCALAIYVPHPPRARDAAGDPTVYQVLSDGSPYAIFGLRQTIHRGTLVPVGSYPTRSDTFTVRLLDRGRDWGDASRIGAHHAAAQMRLTCGDSPAGLRSAVG